jgi:hypothetical protein
MSITVTGATYRAVDYIAERLRASDRQELEAMSGADLQLARRVMTFAAMAYVAFDQRSGTPISAWGLVPLWQGVGSAFAFGTDDWGKALLAMTKHVKRFMIPLVLDHGYHRIECRALAHRDDVASWVGIFGAEQEAVLRSSGRRGEDFILYRWLSDEHRPKHRRTSARDHIAVGDRRGHPAAGQAFRNFLQGERLCAGHGV